jgi:hypothetical protein
MRVYFIQAESGPVKIGIAGDVQKRLDGLQSANHERLAVIAVMEGDPALEAALHARFQPGRIRGEWFKKDTPGLADLLAWLLRFDGIATADDLPVQETICRCGYLIEPELVDRGEEHCWACKKAEAAST